MAAADLSGVTAKAVLTRRCRNARGMMVESAGVCASDGATYVDVTVTKNFQTLVNYMFVPASIAASQSVSMRLK